MNCEKQDTEDSFDRLYANLPLNEIFALLYQELKKLASSKLKFERDDHTLQATALVHEVYLKLESQDKRFETREQFVATVAIAMRRILVDHARRRQAMKRGDGIKNELLDEATIPLSQTPESILEVDEALNCLRELDPQAALLVELKFFHGFNMNEISTLLEISLSKAEKMWKETRAWLYERLKRT